MTEGPTSTVSGRIFISYRREETAYPAGWLYERLTERFGGGRIFKDIDSIHLGDDFVDVITRAVASCDVLLVLIGTDWATVSDEHGRPRLADREDFVRLEIEAALNREVRVIPILVDGATMPRPDELPESLAKLVRKQSLELSPGRFEFDTGRLLKVLDSTLADKHAGNGTVTPAAAPIQPPVAPAVGRPDTQHRRISTRTWVMTAAGAGIVVLILLIAAIAPALRSTPPAAGGIEVDSSPATSGELKLTDLSATSRDDSAAVGDTVTVSYLLTNVGQRSVELADTFVGVRNPTKENVDSENVNEHTILAPGQSLSAQGRIFLDSPGTWTMWPCFTLADGDLCPDKWQAFSLIAH